MNKKSDDKNGKIIFCTQTKSGYENSPNPFDSVYCSTQITLANSIPLTSQVPSCMKIMSHVDTLKILHTKMIDSIEIISDRPIKGKKLIVSGIIQLKIEYISSQDPYQRIYCLNWEQPFNAVLLNSSCDDRLLFSCDFNLNDYMVYIYTEYLNVSCKTEYVLDATIALRIWLQELDSYHSHPGKRCSDETEGGLTLL